MLVVTFIQFRRGEFIYIYIYIYKDEEEGVFYVGSLTIQQLFLFHRQKL